jgi:hypothetical protein
VERGNKKPNHVKRDVKRRQSIGGEGEIRRRSIYERVGIKRRSIGCEKEYCKKANHLKRT